MLNENTLPHSRLHLLVARSLISPAGLAAALLLCVIGSLPACANDWPRWRGTDFNGISKKPVGPPRGRRRDRNNSGKPTSAPASPPLPSATAALTRWAVSTTPRRSIASTQHRQSALETFLRVLNGSQSLRGRPQCHAHCRWQHSLYLQRKGHVFALDARSGNVIWSKTFTMNSA